MEKRARGTMEGGCLPCRSPKAQAGPQPPAVREGEEFEQKLAKIAKEFCCSAGMSAGVPVKSRTEAGGGKE